ncbi:YchJ family metal-binding protein, partial [Escherichia coli]
MSQLCPCGSAVEYSLCCHPYVSGEKVAPDPEHLMRSRYCAFVMQDADYLIKTWHPSCGAAALRAELMAGFAHTEWLGLTVFEHCWQDADNIGFVSFVARFTEGG